MELAILSNLVDEYCLARDVRLAADKTAASLKKAEVELKNRVLGELISNEIGMVGGSKYRVTRQKKSKPKVANWELFNAYILEHGELDLLQRRVGEGAVKLRRDDGINIPGIEFIEINDLSIGKL